MPEQSTPSLSNSDYQIVAKTFQDYDRELYNIDNIGSVTIEPLLPTEAENLLLVSVILSDENAVKLALDNANIANMRTGAREIATLFADNLNKTQVMEIIENYGPIRAPHNRQIQVPQDSINPHFKTISKALCDLGHLPFVVITPINLMIACSDIDALKVEFATKNLTIEKLQEALFLARDINASPNIIVELKWRIKQLDPDAKDIWTKSDSSIQGFLRRRNIINYMALQDKKIKIISFGVLSLCAAVCFASLLAFPVNLIAIPFCLYVVKASYDLYSFYQNYYKPNDSTSAEVADLYKYGDTDLIRNVMNSQPAELAEFLKNQRPNPTDDIYIKASIAAKYSKNPKMTQEVLDNYLISYLAPDKESKINEMILAINKSMTENPGKYSDFSELMTHLFDDFDSRLKELKIQIKSSDEKTREHAHAQFTSLYQKFETLLETGSQNGINAFLTEVEQYLTAIFDEPKRAKLTFNSSNNNPMLVKDLDKVKAYNSNFKPQ